MNKKGLLKIVDYELKARYLISKETDRNIILNLYHKFENQNLSYDEIIRRMITEFKGFNEDYWKHKIERILFSEGVMDKKSDNEKLPKFRLLMKLIKEGSSEIELDEIEKSTKLGKDEYKELLKTKDYSNRPLDNKYYKFPKKGDFWAQMHIRGVTSEEYEDYQSKKIPLWKAIQKHSMHVDLRCSFTGVKRLLQFVLVENNIESYLKVMKGSVDSNTKQVSKGLIVIKPGAMEPSERLKEEEKKEMLLDESGAKTVANLIIESKSYWIAPGQVGATKDKWAYMGAICLGKVESGTMREDFKELFLHSEGENTELWNGRFIFKAFHKPRPLWWVFEAIKTPTPCNPYCMDMETEILTNHGWKYYDAIENQDLFASLNIETKNLEWIEKKHLIHYPYNGEMMWFHNRQTNIMVIPEHKMLIEYGKLNKKLKFIKASDIKSEYNNYIFKGMDWDIPSKTIKIANKSFDENLFCEFMGWYLSEGSVSKHVNYKGYVISIAQQNEKNRNIIRELLKKLNFRFNEGRISFAMDYELDFAEWLLQFGKSYEKYVPEEIKNASKEGISLFLNAYLLGDGTERRGDTYSKNLDITFTNSHERIFYTSSKRMADDLGELILKAGGVPSYYTNKTKGKLVQFSNGRYIINHDIIHIRWNKHIRSELCNLSIEKIEYNGDVWSVDLHKNHTILIRRFGKVSWTGNCEIDSGNFTLLPAERLKHFKKEDYKQWQARKEEC